MAAEDDVVALELELELDLEDVLALELEDVSALELEEEDAVEVITTPIRIKIKKKCCRSISAVAQFRFSSNRIGYFVNKYFLCRKTF